MIRMSRERLYLFDTTLRDGAQTNGVDFTLHDKQIIAQMLDELGIDYVEGGYPGANPADTEFFAQKPKFESAKFTAFGMTRRPGRSVLRSRGRHPGSRAAPPPRLPARGARHSGPSTGEAVMADDVLQSDPPPTRSRGRSAALVAGGVLLGACPPRVASPRRPRRVDHGVVAGDTRRRAGDRCNNPMITAGWGAGLDVGGGEDGLLSQAGRRTATRKSDSGVNGRRSQVDSSRSSAQPAVRESSRNASKA